MAGKGTAAAGKRRPGVGSTQRPPGGGGKTEKEKARKREQKRRKKQREKEAKEARRRRDEASVEGESARASGPAIARRPPKRVVGSDAAAVIEVRRSTPWSKTTRRSRTTATATAGSSLGGDSSGDDVQRVNEFKIGFGASSSSQRPVFVNPMFDSKEDAPRGWTSCSRRWTDSVFKPFDSNENLLFSSMSVSRNRIDYTRKVLIRLRDRYKCRLTHRMAGSLRPLRHVLQTRHPVHARGARVLPEHPRLLRLGARAAAVNHGGGPVIEIARVAPVRHPSTTSPSRMGEARKPSTVESSTGFSAMGAARGDACGWSSRAPRDCCC